MKKEIDEKLYSFLESKLQVFEEEDDIFSHADIYCYLDELEEVVASYEVDSDDIKDNISNLELLDDTLDRIQDDMCCYHDFNTYADIIDDICNITFTTNLGCAYLTFNRDYILSNSGIDFSIPLGSRENDDEIALLYEQACEEKGCFPGLVELDYYGGVINLFKSDLGLLQGKINLIDEAVDLIDFKNNENNAISNIILLDLEKHIGKEKYNKLFERIKQDKSIVAYIADGCVQDIEDLAISDIDLNWQLDKALVEIEFFVEGQNAKAEKYKVAHYFISYIARNLFEE